MHGLHPGLDRLRHQEPDDFGGCLQVSVDDIGKVVGNADRLGPTDKQALVREPKSRSIMHQPPRQHDARQSRADSVAEGQSAAQPMTRQI